MATYYDSNGHKHTVYGGSVPSGYSSTPPSSSSSKLSPPSVPSSPSSSSRSSSSSSSGSSSSDKKYYDSNGNMITNGSSGGLSAPIISNGDGTYWGGTGRISPGQAGYVPPPQPPVNPYQQQLERLQQYYQQLEQQRLAEEERARQLAQAQMEQNIQQRQRIADQTKQSIQSAYDQANQREADQRALQDAQFARQNNPYSGGTDYLRTQLARQREITDQQQTQDLNNKLSSIDTALQDYVNATPEIRAQIEANLVNQARNYALNAGQQFLQANNQQFNQMMDQFRTLAPYQFLTAAQQSQLPLQWAQTMGTVPAPMNMAQNPFSVGNAQIQSLVSEIQRRRALGQSVDDLVFQLEQLVG